MDAGALMRSRVAARFRGDERVIVVNAARFVTVELAGTITGLGSNAVRKRIERGIWLEDVHWRRAHDGRIWIDMKAVERWIEQSP
ncbi:excisionase [Variovorax sp. YR216]|uniref:excisionase n=1 Tax=Variovorax sp. YR216 TaxID=1882828 RepID=UPI0008948CEF|nr:excisionase [Variovorax sp. YR216]SEA76364.1 hypothetical protein SAMN05444680_103477 [Variovorax sp. YR216]